MATRVSGHVAILFAAVAAGCAPQSTPPHARPDDATSVSSADPHQPATTEPQDMKDRPFMFGEANLPRDYPPPGPVGQVLVKHYPPARVAVSRGNDQNAMFMPLFNHIKRRGIAMSAPVEITWSDPQAQPTQATPQAMAFVYGAPDIGKPGTDGNVDVLDVPAQTVLSIGVRGSYDRRHLVEGLTKLREWLAAHPTQFEAAGPPRYLGYNSPFVPSFLKYGEVQLPIRPVQPQP